MRCRSTAVAFVLLLVGCSLLAGCGGGRKPSSVASLGATAGASSTTSSSSPSVGDDGQPSSAAMMSKQLALSTCMRAHGEPRFPDPLPGGGYPRTGAGGIDQLDPKSPQYAEALAACRSEAVASGVIHSPAQRQAHIEQLDAEDACIRTHGVPDMPDAGANGVQRAPPRGVSAAKMQAAERACAYLNP
jgi:hypothetical protein